MTSDALQKSDVSKYLPRSCDGGVCVHVCVHVTGGQIWGSSNFLQKEEKVSRLRCCCVALPCLDESKKWDLVHVHQVVDMDFWEWDLYNV